MTRTRRRFVVLWSEFPGYATACVRELIKSNGGQVTVVRYAHGAEKPFANEVRELSCPVCTISERDSRNSQWAKLEAILEEFKPDVALVGGWAIAPFKQAARWVKTRGGTVICMSDNQWLGTLKQRVGAMCAKLLFRKRYDAMFVPGERQRIFARKCGFTGRRLISGMYSCDRPLFARAHETRVKEHPQDWPQAFVFVGSLIKRKGIHNFLRAYSLYRQRVSDPWELRLVGDGPLRKLVQDQAGVQALGFQQPAECAQILSEAGAFAIASHHEGWVLVLHEATSAGLPVLCSRQCGSQVELVTDGYNGYSFEAGDVGHLTELMVRLSSKGDAELREMGRRSFELSGQFSPARWAANLLAGIEMIRQHRQDGP